jgi:hypothetical protein
VKLIHVIESIIHSRDPAVKHITDKELIDIIKLCIDHIESEKSIKKIYEVVKKEYEYEKG